ncbi:hypothetical protein OXYTRIMIC_298 [Oxytricha trifallax]|uniref:MT-A70 family protein n=1 Tax=Oxytricha trifallax TaxID=1172189 RepID=A0A073HZY9_9SPIT|nr:hypothetical protein OXYTRIMIC_298 [Oxytricha trifallax]
MKVPGGQEWQIIKQRVQKMVYKNLTNPVLYEGDVLDLKMWQQIAEDVLKKHGKLYEVIVIDPPWKLKQDLPYPPLLINKYQNFPCTWCKREELQFCGQSTRKKNWQESFQRFMAIKKWTSVNGQSSQKMGPLSWVGQVFIALQRVIPNWQKRGNQRYCTVSQGKVSHV